LWRFGARRGDSEAAERRAQQLVAASFFVLAAYVGVESLRTFFGAHDPETSWVGIGHVHSDWLRASSSWWSSARSSGFGSTARRQFAARYRVERGPVRGDDLDRSRGFRYFSGLKAFVVDPFAPNLIAFRRVSSNFERM
jgi:hypothetical protein